MIGEEITQQYPYYLRSMSNPKSGYGIPSPDCYNGTYWNTNTDVHYRSGVLNKWYYLLTEGGNGTNDINNAYAVNGIGIDEASKIAYKTEQLLNSNADYAMARIMSIQAAQQLYGVGSCEEAAVTRAWYAVGVGANYSNANNNPNNYSIAGNTMCSSQEFYINNLYNDPNATVTWSADYTDITLSPSPNFPQRIVATLGANVAGVTQFNLYATITSSACQIATTITTVIYISSGGGIPARPTVSFEPCGYWVSASIPPLSLGTTYTWNLDGYEMTTTQASLYIPTYYQIGYQPIFPLAPGQHSLKVKVSNACGNSGYPIKPPPVLFTTSTCTPNFAPGGNGTETNVRSSVSPNPTTGQFVVTLTGSSKMAVIKEVRIRDKFNAIIFDQTYKNGQKQQSINLYKQQTDIYIVEIFDGTTWTTQKLSLLK